MLRGLSYASMGKTSYYGSFGARLLVNKARYDLWTRLRYAESAGASEQVLGAAQEAWLIELIGSSVTCPSFKEVLAVTVATNPALADFEAAALLVEAMDGLLVSSSMMTNPHLGYARSDLHGFVIVALDGDKLDGTYHQIAVDLLLEDHADDLDVVRGAYELVRFRVNAGERELYQEIDGAWRRWNRATMTWV